MKTTPYNYKIVVPKMLSQRPEVINAFKVPLVNGKTINCKTLQFEMAFIDDSGSIVERRTDLAVVEGPCV